MNFLSFTLKNYKGISDAITINIDKAAKPCCIVGSNEAGKTTILKGIHCIGRLCHGDTLENGELNEILPKLGSGGFFSDTVELSTEVLMAPNEKEEFNGSFEIPDEVADENKLSIAFIYEFKNNKCCRQKTEVRIKDYLLSSNEAAKSYINFIHEHIQEIVYWDEFSFSVPSTIRFLKSGFSTDDRSNDVTLCSNENKNMQSIFNDLLLGAAGVEEYASNAFQEHIVDWNIEEDGEDTIDQRMLAINNYLNLVLEDWEEIIGEKKIFKEVEIARKSINDIFVDFQLRIKAETASFHLHERSTGFQWFFCFKVLTEVRRNRSKNGTLFLLDEPASNLHIEAQKRILQSLEKLSNQNNSVIYTTHSSSLINLDEIESLLLAHNQQTDELGDASISLENLSSVDMSDAKKQKALAPVYETILKSIGQSCSSNEDGTINLAKAKSAISAISEKGETLYKGTKIIQAIEYFLNKLS